MSWETHEAGLFMSNAVVVGDALYGLSHLPAGQFFALDLKTGKVLWKTRGREAENTAIVKADNVLFLLNDNAELIVARPSRAGVRAGEALHGGEERHLGAAGGLRQPHFRQGRVVAHAMDGGLTRLPARNA